MAQGTLLYTRLGTIGTSSLRLSIQCPVCLELFKEPKILSCGHTFCKACLQDIIIRSSPDERAREIVCPTCRANTRPARLARRAEDLTTNYVLVDVIDRLQNTGALDESVKLDNAGASESDETSSDCVQSDCIGLTMVQERRSSLDVARDCRQVEICAAHGRVLDRYCSQHSMVMCATCVVKYNHACELQNVKEIATQKSVQRTRTEIDNEISELQDNLEAVVFKVSENISAVKIQLEHFPRRLHILKRDLNKMIDQMIMGDEPLEAKSNVKAIERHRDELKSVLAQMSLLTQENNIIGQHGTLAQQFIALRDLQNALPALKTESKMNAEALELLKVRHTGVDALQGILKLEEFLGKVEIIKTKLS